MVTDSPKVSIVIPAYNSAATTVETVESVLAQTYPHFEVVVVDDGSTDCTREALAPYSSRIRYLYKENGGACSARNLGIAESNGEYVACLDCDDLWLPKKLQRSVAALEESPDTGLVFTACSVIDSAGGVLNPIRCDFGSEWVYDRLLRGNFIPAPTVVMRRKCLDEVGGFDERIFVPADWDLWLRLARAYPVAYIDEALSTYRNVSNYSIRSIATSFQEVDYVLRKHIPEDTSAGRAIRRQVWGSVYFDYAMALRSVLDYRRARRMLFRSLKYRPTNWKVYAHCIASLFGASVWTRTQRKRTD